jgi:riboflavin-specific deaminase-like protein
MVTTADGRAVVNGRAQGIGSPVDRRLMRQLRAQADAVLVGAGTLRAENVDPSVPADLAAARTARGMPPQPLAVATSASLDLPLQGTFFRSDRFPRAVITARRAPSDRLTALQARARILVAGDATLDLAEGLRLLRRELGVRWLLCEGGPTLNAALLAAGLIDELFWTLAPTLVGGPEAAMIHDSGADARYGLALVALHHHEGELYLRYRRA